MPQIAKGELSGTVRDWMSRTPLRVPPDTSVGRVAGLMRTQGIRHVFRLYALDVDLALPPGSTKTELLKAIEGHVIAHAELVGRRQKGGR
jgi:phosphatidylethanolamine-binding protein (PEBP) family uncharacterized protein